MKIRNMISGAEGNLKVGHRKIEVRPLRVTGNGFWLRETEGRLLQRTSCLLCFTLAHAIRQFRRNGTFGGTTRPLNEVYWH